MSNDLAADAALAGLHDYIERLEAEINRLREESANEVAEFNAGYECAMEGGSVHDQPSDRPYDVWEVGFAWAIWNKEKHA